MALKLAIVPAYTSVIVHQALQQHFLNLLWQLAMGALVKYNWKSLQSRRRYRQSLLCPCRCTGSIGTVLSVRRICGLSFLTRVVLAISKLLIG